MTEMKQSVSIGKVPKRQKIEANVKVPEEETIEDTSNFNVNAWSKLGVQDLILKALAEAHFDNPTPIQVQL
jgi:superfamily II DNA/RNA helicase